MFEMSTCPMTDLIYISSDTGGTITEAAECRTDKILGYGTSERLIQNMFNDFVSLYSPLTAEAGDDYLLPSRRVFNEFLL